MLLLLLLAVVLAIHFEQYILLLQLLAVVLAIHFEQYIPMQGLPQGLILLCHCRFLCWSQQPHLLAN